MVYLKAPRGAPVIASAPPSASPSPPVVRLGVLAGLLAAALLPPAPLRAAERDPYALLDRMEAAWKARDAEGYLALWRYAEDDRRRQELEYVTSRWASEESQLEIERPMEFARSEVKVSAAIVSITEPRARVEQVVFTLRSHQDGWVVVDRVNVAQIDGLVHLSLAAQGFRADGAVLRLPDFEMRFRRGTLFMPPTTLGPTVLVFVGQATVHFTPGPETEKEQLRQFCGRTELVEDVRAVFVRIHPADLHHVLVPALLEPDPRSEAARSAAQRFFREHVDDTYLLDASLPRSPWWLMPGVGDAVATFPTRRGTLTFALSQSEPEPLSLFDRAHRRQINLYAPGGDVARYDEDAQRDVDVLHHDLSVRFDPEHYGVIGEDVLRLRLVSAASTIRLRLDESLKVISIRSKEAGEHLFFRVRHQDSVMVSLGALAGTIGELTFTVRYAGAHRPQPIEHEVLAQVSTPSASAPEVDIRLEDSLVYSNRTAWYPQGSADDYATASMRFDVPAGEMAVAGGQLLAVRTEGGRTKVEYRQDRPAKYITVALGRLQEAGRRVAAEVAITAFAVPRLKASAAERLDQTAAILRFYAEEFGPCPYPTLNLALMESPVPGGHSPPGMVVLSIRPALLRGSLRDDPASFPDAPDFFIAHELAHQWWGQGVAGENYHERWLSEAFAQYAAALWVRHSRGDDAFRGMLARMGKWALRYASKGPIHLGHRLGHIENDAQVYRAIVYDKGAYVLHMLRQIVGDDAFRGALQALQRDHRFGKIGSDDVRAALETASGLDLRAYFAEWVYGTRVPELRLASRSRPAAEGYRTEITVHGSDLPGPVPLEVAVAHTSGTSVRTVQLDPEGGTWTVDTPGAPRRVDVNGSRGLLARVRRD